MWTSVNGTHAQGPVLLWQREHLSGEAAKAGFMYFVFGSDCCPRLDMAVLAAFIILRVNGDVLMEILVVPEIVYSPASAANRGRSWPGRLMLTLPEARPPWTPGRRLPCPCPPPPAAS